MESIDSALLKQRAAELKFYSPYNFLRGINIAEKQQDLFGFGRIARFAHSPLNSVFTHSAGQFLYTALPWDSTFFKTPTYRLVTVLFADNCPLAERITAVQSFRQELSTKGPYYCFGEIPSEDTPLLQLLTASGWQLIETRLSYYQDQLSTHNQPRYAVRVAQWEDEAIIAQIAATARNEYDRFHADPWFGATRADAFLARYATAAVQGYCDTVLVPAESDVPVDSFLAISNLQSDAAALGVGLAKVVLTAVGPQNRGWHLRLVSETLHRAHASGAHAVLMTTQATNRPVSRTCEKLGFKLGSAGHILACYSN